jgi:hypothetical protein
VEEQAAQVRGELRVVLTSTVKSILPAFSTAVI